MPPEPDGTFILCFCLTLFSLLLCALYAAGESALENLSLSQLKDVYKRQAYSWGSIPTEPRKG